MTEPTVKFQCKNGHKITVPLHDGEKFAYTACGVCFKPLFPVLVGYEIRDGHDPRN